MGKTGKHSHTGQAAGQNEQGWIAGVQQAAGRMGKVPLRFWFEGFFFSALHFFLKSNSMQQIKLVVFEYS